MRLAISARVPVAYGSHAFQPARPPYHESEPWTSTAVRVSGRDPSCGCRHALASWVVSLVGVDCWELIAGW
jgi:hypothetical protein